MSRPIDSLKAAFADIEGSDPKQDARVAAGFVQDDRYDEYLDMATRDPDRFDKLPRQVKLAVGHYQSQRDAARRAGGTV